MGLDAKALRAAATVAALAPVIAIGIPLQTLILKFRLGDPARIPVLFHRYALRAIGVTTHVVGAPAKARPLLMTSNHSSWLDILVLGAITPVSFVAKSEIASWPVFGSLARLQRSIFVDRARRTATSAVSREMAERMQAGDAVVLFAEGTSSDGNRVLPFRSALLGAAQQAIGGEGAGAVYVQPVSIAYVKRNGLPLGLRTRSEIAWYGDIDFVPHLWAVLRNGAIDVTVAFGTPVRVDASANRKTLTRELEQQVRRMTASALRGGVRPAAIPSDAAGGLPAPAPALEG
ncbi:1-acyl-sn-glycerol-3-phosphate acyltransferase [Methylopila capsulata]|uniref:1-acyl-sn-glycerol-3-phosphate acyltransferase n=1 Tax=Methylopila capsulata TaxID=61654 RepID=A0A9W6IT84_9HYPH|nr:lysophospholipid acyltransferase family protein [Methylopila capsulata]MBM7851735.1 1-acyl-sn-glycerol-3-phosphate acyltransferase [Methylopila capsulata]GLK54795.1 1-acyl-sn-glycerol-3-phosphate acyltransferase [Methylopila capsulata]